VWAKALLYQGFLAEREGFEPSIRVAPDKHFQFVLDGPRTSMVVHPELTSSPIDALPSTGIRARPAPYGSRWGSENARLDSNPIATLTLAL
jgi:hypothetical protein